MTSISETMYGQEIYQATVKPRLEVHMDMILFEVFFFKEHKLIPQQHILQRHYLYYR